MLPQPGPTYKLAQKHNPATPKIPKSQDTRTGVDVGVLLHVRLLVKPLSAVLARVGPGVRVDEQVRRERRGPLEGLAALLALEGAFRRVHGSVLAQAHLVAEGLVAELAGERSLAAVRPPGVHFQSVRCGEHLVALEARVHVGQRVVELVEVVQVMTVVRRQETR